MDDLRKALSALDSVETPDLWPEIERRASVPAPAPTAAGVRFQPRLSTATLLVAGIVVVVLGGLLLSGLLTTREATPQVPAADPTPSPTTTAASGASRRAFTMTANVPYMTVGDRDVYLDIYAPTSDAPWPVVVMFPATPSRDARTTYDVATEAAAQGMLVITPSWFDRSVPFTSEVAEQLRLQTGCAIAVAQEQAAELGGDPERTVAYGWLASSTAAMQAALAPVEGPIPGCATDAPAIPVAGVVAGEGDYLQYTEFFDEAIDADPAEMQTHGAAIFDPEGWPEDLDASFILWAATDGGEQREVAGLVDESGLLLRQDPTGSLAADLERLGLVEDGVISMVDAAQVMAERLESAGLEVTLDEYPGGTGTLDKVPELIEYMRVAAGE